MKWRHWARLIYHFWYNIFYQSNVLFFFESILNNFNKQWSQKPQHYSSLVWILFFEQMIIETPLDDESKNWRVLGENWEKNLWIRWLIVKIESDNWPILYPCKVIVRERTMMMNMQKVTSGIIITEERAGDQKRWAERGERVNCILNLWVFTCSSFTYKTEKVNRMRAQNGKFEHPFDFVMHSQLFLFLLFQSLREETRDNSVWSAWWSTARGEKAESNLYAQHCLSTLHL